MEDIKTTHYYEALLETREADYYFMYLPAFRELLRIDKKKDPYVAGENFLIRQALQYEIEGDKLPENESVGEVEDGQIVLAYSLLFSYNEPNNTVKEDNLCGIKGYIRSCIAEFVRPQSTKGKHIDTSNLLARIAGIPKKVTELLQKDF